MGDGLFIWLLVGALVPLVWYSVVPTAIKPNFLVLMALGVAGAVVGGPIGEMLRPEADLYGFSAIIGAAVGSVVFTAAHRIVSNVLNTVVPTQVPQFTQTTSDEPRPQRSRTI